MAENFDGHRQRPPARRPDAWPSAASARPSRSPARRGCSRASRATAAQVIGREQIVNLPLNGRAYADLALLSPGVRQSSISTSRDASFNVNGLRSSLNNFMLDGVDNNSYGTSNQGFSNQVVQVTPDAVEEFKVQTNNFSAEFGRAGGAVINATFRSGTNQFHGTALGVQPQHEAQRDRLLQAVVGRQSRRSTATSSAASSAGRSSRTARSSSSTTRASARSPQLTFASIPTMAQRQGILGKPVRNPLTGEVYADGVIPQAAITDFAAQGAGGTAVPTRRASRTTSNRCRAGRTTTTSSTSSSISSSARRRARSSASATARSNNFEPPPIPGETSSPPTPTSRCSTSSSRRRDAHARADLAVRRAPRRLAHRGRQDGARHGHARTCCRPTASRGLPDDTVFCRRPDAAVRQRLDGMGPAEQQPAVPESASCSTRASTTRRSAAATPSRPATSISTINTDIDDVHPKYGADTYGGQFSRPSRRGVRRGDLTTWPTSWSARARATTLSTPSSSTSASACTSATCRTTGSVAPKLTVNAGRALRVRARRSGKTATT